MKKRKVQLAGGNHMVINDIEWTPVIDRKEFDANGTEIVRVTRHTSGLLTRVYVMRSHKGPEGGMLIDKEENHMVPGTDISSTVAKAIADCGLTKIASVEIP